MSRRARQRSQGMATDCHLARDRDENDQFSVDPVFDRPPARRSGNEPSKLDRILDELNTDGEAG